MKPAGFAITVDADGAELARTTAPLQALSRISEAGDDLVLWGAFSNTFAVVKRDGSIEQGHTLERDGYSGFTDLHVHDGRLTAVMNDGYGPNGYRMVPVAQDLSGSNPQRGLVDLYVTSFVALGRDLILVGSKDDAKSMTSATARYSLADDKTSAERTYPRYSECSMAVLLQARLLRACTLAGDSGFERVLSSVDTVTLEEEASVTLERPIRAIAATPDGRLLVASDNQLEVFDHDLSRLGDSVPLPADRTLTLADFQSSYVLGDHWFLMLKSPRLDVGATRTHVATALVIDLRTATLAKTVSVDLDRTGEMSSVVVIPGNWFRVK